MNEDEANGQEADRQEESDREIIVRFWGVRGSIPSPGPQTARYGGNTSCISIEGANEVTGRRYIGVFDAGTGIRLLGQSLKNNRTDLILLLTHLHWDHIQGFPFFAPLYEQDRRILLALDEERRGLFRQLLEQMDGTHFPLTQDEITSEVNSLTPPEVHRFAAEGYHVSRIRTNHPGECFGFRADLRGVRVCYIPDNELAPPGTPRLTREALADFCRNADVLIHDAQYTKADMTLKHGWGHSVLDDVWELALAAEVKHLVLFHHDPDRTDAQLDDFAAQSRAYFARHAPQIQCTVAHEGLELRFLTAST